MLMMSNGAFVPTYKLCFFQNEGLGQTDNLGYIFTFCDFQSHLRGTGIKKMFLVICGKLHPLSSRIILCF